MIFPLIGIIALGTWTMSVVGVFFSLLTINIRLRELMLPVIFYPMLIPALLGASSRSPPRCWRPATSARTMKLKSGC